MSNTGKKIFNTLTQIYVHNGEPTGVTKDNDPSDPDYIPPTEDDETCPPPDPVEPINSKIIIQVRNKMIKQSIALKNFAARSSSSNDQNGYYFNSELQLLPDQSVSSGTSIQIDDINTVKFQAKAVALDGRVKMIVSYKKGSEAGYTTLLEKSFFQGDLVEENGIVANRENNSTNILRIDFVDDAALQSPVTPPTVNAGPNREVTITEQPETLTGLVIQGTNSIASILWTQISGPTVAVIENADQLEAKVSAMQLGEYVFALTAVDIAGVTVTDLVTLIVIESVDPNGLVNLYVDPNMENESYKIEQVTLTDANGSVDILDTPITKSSGIILKHPLKGTYKVAIKLAGDNINGAHSLRVSWAGGNEVRVLNLPSAGIYVFEDVVVGEDIDGLLISFLNGESPIVTGQIIFAKLTMQPTTLQANNILPNGLLQNFVGNVEVEFFSDQAGTVPVNFEGRYNYALKTDYYQYNLDSIEGSSFIEPMVLNVNEEDKVLMADVQEYKLFDFNVGNQPIEHRKQTWIPVSGEGYLIIS